MPVSVNDDRDEENTDANGGPLLDNEPHMGPGRKGHRIVSGDDELKYVTLSGMSEGTSLFPLTLMPTQSV